MSWDTGEQASVIEKRNWQESGKGHKSAEWTGFKGIASTPLKLVPQAES